MLQTQIGKVVKKRNVFPTVMAGDEAVSRRNTVRMKRTPWWKDWHSGSKTHVCFLGWGPFSLEKWNCFPYVTNFTTFPHLLYFLKRNKANTFYFGGEKRIWPLWVDFGVNSRLCANCGTEWTWEKNLIPRLGAPRRVQCLSVEVNAELSTWLLQSKY